MKKLCLVVLITVLSTAGCSKPDLSQYRDDEPHFSLFDYFQGKTTGWGIVQDRKGNLLRRFVVDIQGTMHADKSLTLEEHFQWNDGELSSRTWNISKTGEHTFTGTAADVHGSAAGAAYGNVLNWRYFLDIEASGRTWKVYLDDWMFLHDDDILINKTKMSKFGFALGEITIVFRKGSRQEQI